MAVSIKRKCRLVLCIILLTAPAISLLAQNPVVRLQDLVIASQTNQPSILKRQAKVSSDLSTIKDVRHTALPLLKLHDQISLASANGATGTFFPLGIIVPTAGAIRDKNYYEPATGNIAMIYTEYELANFGLNKARVEDAVAIKTLDEIDVAKTTYLNSLNTSRNYFQLLKAYKQLSIERENVKRYDTLFSIIRAQAASGLRAGADSSATLAELSKARAAFNTRTGEIARIREDLSYLTGVSIDQLNIDTSLSKYKESEKIHNETLRLQASVNPLLEFVEKEKEVTLSKRNLIKKGYLPKILLVGGAWGRGTSLNYNEEYLPLSKGLGYQRFNYAVGLAFNYNLFDIVHRRDKLEINKFEVLEKEYAIEEQKNQLHTLIQKANAALQVIAQNMHELPVQLMSAGNLYQQKLAQYRAGVSNLVDLTNAAFLLYQAQSDNIQIVTDWYMASLDKAAAEGNLLEFIQNIK